MHADPPGVTGPPRAAEEPEHLLVGDVLRVALPVRVRQACAEKPVREAFYSLIGLTCVHS